MKYIKNFLYIPEKEFTLNLEEKLTFRNPNFDSNIKNNISVEGIAEVFILYSKVKSKSGKIFYKVPRYALGQFDPHAEGIKCLFPHLPIKIEWDKSAVNSDGDPVILNDSQEKTVMQTKHMLLKHNGGTLIAETGEGKTTMAINLITDLGLKTLILCHKDKLIEQWNEELLHLTNLKKSDIGKLQQGKFKDGKVVIGSQRSLMNDTFDSSINDMFSLVIQDETHLIGAEMFLKSFSRFNPIYRLGLSATPNREDGLEEIYRLHLGSSFFRHRSVRTVPLKYKMYEYSNTKWGWHQEYIPQKTRLINDIVKDKNRDYYINELIAMAFASKRKKIIVFSERIKHLKNLMYLAEGTFPKKKIVRFFGVETESRKRKKWRFTFKKNDVIEVKTVGKLKVIGFNQKKDLVKFVWFGSSDINEVTIDDLLDNPAHHLRKYIAKRMVTETITLDEYEDPSYEELVNADIIFATYTKAKDGVNIPPLDTLIYATPFGSSTTLEQSAGRIKRKYEGKEYGLIIDIYDSGNNISEGLRWKRKHTYDFLNIEKIT
jgi:superfamily II DNA or RNA helicase